MPYYRHPSSAACFPAPSGCHLRGSVEPRGLRGASAEILDFQMPIFFGDPPKSLLPLGEFSEKKRPIGRRDLAAKIQVFIVPNKTLSGNGVQIVIVFFTQNWPQIHRNFDLFLIFSPKSILFTRRPPAPPSVRRSNALCKESIR